MVVGHLLLRRGQGRASSSAGRTSAVGGESQAANRRRRSCGKGIIYTKFSVREQDRGRVGGEVKVPETGGRSAPLHRAAGRGTVLAAPWRETLRSCHASRGAAAGRRRRGTAPPPQDDPPDAGIRGQSAVKPPEVGAARTGAGSNSFQRMLRVASVMCSWRGRPSSPIRPQVVHPVGRVEFLLDLEMRLPASVACTSPLWIQDGVAGRHREVVHAGLVDPWAIARSGSRAGDPAPRLRSARRSGRAWAVFVLRSWAPRAAAGEVGRGCPAG